MVLKRKNNLHKIYFGPIYSRLLASCFYGVEIYNYIKYVC
jgi:hypothetical protein